jgi:hypothetical protein
MDFASWFFPRTRFRLRKLAGLPVTDLKLPILKKLGDTTFLAYAYLYRSVWTQQTFSGEN